MSKQGVGTRIGQWFGDLPLSVKPLILALGPMIVTFVVLVVLVSIALSQSANAIAQTELKNEITVLDHQIADYETHLAAQTNALAADPVLLDAVERGNAAAVQMALASASVRLSLGHIQVVDSKGQSLGLVQQFSTPIQMSQLARLYALGLLEIQSSELIATDLGWLWVVVRPVKTSRGLVGAISVGQLVNAKTVSAWNFERSNPILTIFDLQGNVQPFPGVRTLDPKSLDWNLWAQAKIGQVASGQVAIDGQPYGIAYAPLKVGDKIATVYSVAVSIAPVTGARNQVVFVASVTISVMAVLFGLLVLFIGRRYIIHPIVALANGAELVAAGQLDVSVPETTFRDEIGRLARTFNVMTLQLRQTLGHLEQRTTELVRQRNQLETAAQVAREATIIRDVEQVLQETARLISDRFGFYHVGLYLLGEARQYAVLRAASSPGGQRLLARGHRLRVGQEGIIGYVTGRGEPRIALDVGADALFLSSPDLPDTRSEVVLPLRARGEIIGALDVQSTQPAAFSQDDATVLQTLADQIAVTISNARLFQQVQKSLEAERRAYGELGREGWRRILSQRLDLAERYDPQRLLPTDGEWREEMKLAVNRGVTVRGQGPSSAALAAPIKVRGQVIGVLDALKPASGGEWTQEQVALIVTLAEQLSVALESARLYQDTQRRAAREQLLSEVTARIRASLDMETVLETTLDEIHRAMGLDEVTIHLAMGETRAAPAGNGRE
jgi:GAF domain-containing protein/HAMP domain-containing protein